jgi:isocitrate dehydrogenase kinase/phosphatase
LFRNKAAYLVGKVMNGHLEAPFAVPVLQNSRRELFLDALLFDAEQLAVLFSFSRAYFFVDMEVPAATVSFLRTLMPMKPRAEIYMSLGLHKQGKTIFYRDLHYHLSHSSDNFSIAPGIKGMVMLVFTLPSFPYVFKVIRDRFAPPKEGDCTTVKKKYLLVKFHDRVGRLADTLEYSLVALPISRFDPALLEELESEAASSIEKEGDCVVIKHMYIERRMQPLNLYLEEGMRDNDTDRLRHVLNEYGTAIKELAGANIFPGDMLLKNFGVTRHNRVVFYDYDEIAYMTDCNFRHIPAPTSWEDEMSAEPYYTVGPNDVFPEQFARFLVTDTAARGLLLERHADLMDPGFWIRKQARIRAGQQEDIYPYPEEIRFSR